MTAGLYNLTLEQGVDFSQVLVWSNSGTAMNLTGYTAKMQARKSADNPTAAISFTTADSTILITPLTGTIALKQTSTVLDAVQAGTYVYDLELTSAGGVVTRLIAGTLTLTASVTR